MTHTFGGLAISVAELNNDDIVVAVTLTPVDGDGACRHVLTLDADDLETLLVHLASAGVEAFGWEWDPT